MLSKLFGKKKKEANPDKGLQTLQNLNTQIDTLEKKLDFLDKQGNDLTKQAKAKLKAGDKGGAKKLLTKKISKSNQAIRRSSEYVRRAKGNVREFKYNVMCSIH